MADWSALRRRPLVFDAMQPKQPALTRLAVGILLVQTVGILSVWRAGLVPASGAALLAIVSSGCAVAALALAIRESVRDRERASQSALVSGRLRQAMECGQVVAWDWDVLTGKDTWFGDLKTMFGIPGEIYEGRVEDFRQRVHPDDRELVWRAVVDARQNRTTYRAKFRLLWPDGTVRWADASGAFHYAPNGEAVRMLGVAADITERKQLENAARETDERFRAMADTAPVMLWMSGPDKSCVYVNRSWLEFTGRPLEAELGDGWAESLHPADRPHCLDTYHQAFDRREPFRSEHRLRRHDGEYRWLVDNGVPRFTPDGSFAGYIGSSLDVTDQKLAGEALSGLSQKLMAAQEKERARIARELHDGLGQRMALLTIELERLRRALPEAAGDLPLRLGELCERTIGLGKDIHAISHDLHSPTLEFLGITSASEVLCQELGEKHDVEIDFSHEGIPRDLSSEVSLTLFRVLQEALTNAVTHSGVNRVMVTLRGEPGQIQLEVCDGGVGFDASAALKNRALGLVGMQERLRLVKGCMGIESQPGSGTKVWARVPLAAA
jgi:PAS domain S-box-containing protein